MGVSIIQIIFLKGFTQTVKMVRIHREPKVFPRFVLIDNCIRQQEFFMLKTIFLHLLLKCLVKKDPTCMDLISQILKDIKWLRFKNCNESEIRTIILRSIANSSKFHSYIRTSIHLFYTMNKPI